MPDLDELRDPRWHLASATEIRRRGERYTRRRHLRTSLVALGVGLLAAVPVISLGFGDGTREQEPPAASWLPTVPAGFDLDSGLPAASEAPPVLSAPDPDLLTRVPVCGRSHWLNGAPQRATDVLIATNGAGGSVHDERLLLVYPDDATAREAVRTVRRWADACAEAGSSDGLRATDLGGDAESWGYAVPGDVRGGIDSLLVVRVGNAMLLDRSAADGAAPAGDTVDRLEVRSAAVVEQMCVFAQDPC